MRRALAAALAGAASVPAYSHGELFPVTLAAHVVLVHLWLRARTPAAALGLGFAFGLGLFGAGVSWVYVSLHRYGAMPAPLAVFATLGFCAFLALFPALAGWLQARLRYAEALRAALGIPALWMLSEWLRGWVLTGFPWLSLGYAAIDDPLAGYAPVAGLYAVSLAAMAAAGALWCILFDRARRSAALGLALLVLAGLALRLVEWSAPAGARVTASLLQGNVPQDMKFDPGRYARTLETYALLVEQSRARLIVLPETAVPRFFDRVEPAFLARLALAARRNDGDVLLGVPFRAGEDYYNSVVSLGTAPGQIYHKRHLVPFGEFVPPGFGWIVGALSIPLSDFSRGAARQLPLEVAGQKIAVNICYEDAYGAEIARMLPEATLLVNVSNVAWFGDSLAPAQHLQIARMRALETGRMHLTATNTGITAAIEADGAVRARLPQFSEGRLETEVQARVGATPYVRLGDGPALALALVLAALGAALRKR